MTKKCAIFFRLPFEKKSLCICESDSGIIVNQGHGLLYTDEVICLNFDDYIQDVKSPSCIPSVLFDVNLAVRVLCGLPEAKFHSDSAPWKGISCLGKHLKTDHIFPVLKSIENGTFGNYRDWIKKLPEGWAAILIEALKKEHSRLVSELEAEGLLGQFLNVEMPLRCMFSRVGINGIKIDRDRIDSKYRALDHEYYSAVKTLEIKYGFIVKQRSRKISYEEIKKFVEGYNPEDFSKKYFWDSIELMQETSEFLKSLLIEHRNGWDLSELLRISSALSGSCKIDYDVFGTVTGRILLRRPGIQYVKRTSRDIFSPRNGYAFVYADYAQFEPGILASFSGDSRLIALYNAGDIYSGLAKEIGGDCTRKIAKEVFLSFIYGMSRDNIRYRISRRFNDGASIATDAFFDQFSLVEGWKKNVVEDTKKSAMIKGPFSYIRRVSEEDTDRDIERWAPNHIIQSTASGIFKNALCSLVSELKQCRLLIPMHDAILLECPTREVPKVQKEVERIMIESFQKTCKGVNVRVSFEPFSLEK